jgi:hypothetical protein
LIGVLGGGGGGGAHTPTTVNPLVHTLRHLPVTTTTLSPFERALRSLPLATTSPATTPTLAPTTTPVPAFAASASPPLTIPSTTGAPRVSAPAPVTTHPAPVRSIVPTTVLPVTTMTTLAGQADLTWYLANGSIFNLLQTDIEKLDRAVGSASQSTYSTVHPYWQQLSADVAHAATVPPIPDAASRATWGSALSDLRTGASQSINGTPDGTGVVLATFEQGAALITTGTTELDGALASVQGTATGASAPARARVRAWFQSHGSVLTTIQADMTKLNTDFSSSPTGLFTLIARQQLLTEGQSAQALPAIPDSLTQSYWSTSLTDIIQGTSDCMVSSESLPPSLFDQGVALIQSGGSYLGTTAHAVQSLAG